MNLRARVRSGDPDAFGTLFDEHARAVYSYAFQRTGSRPDAEEVVSLTFLEAWRRRDRIEPDGGSLKPWLLGISVNVLRNLRRAQRRHRDALARLPDPAPMPDFSDEVAGRLDDAAQLATVLAALTQLRRGQREVVTLCVWAGLDYAAAAEALGVPVGTVRSRLARARQELRRRAGLAAGEPAGQPGQLEGSRAIAAQPTRRSAR
jgi:RNA polymerase sigma factor (sigma-70 family)